jgi:DNA-directed RNA polymerase subunit M/transcription elongation factor TFIIS
MTHIPGNPIDFDEPFKWPSVIPREEQHCPRSSCKNPDIWWREHESSDGAYEDTELRCRTCGYRWWVDGPDS